MFTKSGVSVSMEVQGVSEKMLKYIVGNCWELLGHRFNSCQSKTLKVCHKKVELAKIKLYKNLTFNTIGVKRTLHCKVDESKKYFT